MSEPSLDVCVEWKEFAIIIECGGPICAIVRCQPRATGFSDANANKILESNIGSQARASSKRPAQKQDPNCREEGLEDEYQA